MGGLALNGKRVKREWIPDLVESFVMNNGLKGMMYYICGSYRRGAHDSGDIEIVFHPKDEEQRLFLRTKIREIFGCTQDYEPKMQGLYGEVQYDLFIADDLSLGAMLMHATGSGQFNIIMRAKYKRLGLRLNQYGVWRGDTPVVRGLDEQRYFAYLGIDYKVPEERNV